MTRERWVLWVGTTEEQHPGSFRAAQGATTGLGSLVPYSCWAHKIGVFF